MGDKCVCGHEEREHDERPHWVGDLYTWVETCSHVDHDGPCACVTYRRSPLSAFRWPRVTWSREEAADALALIGFTHSADAARFGDLRRRRASMHELLDCARYDLACGSACRHQNAALGLLAARIIRGVRA